jgi:WD40 repeat protein
LLVGRHRFSPDGRIFALSDPDRIKLCDSETGKLVAALAVAKASAIAFSPDSRFFAGSGTTTGEAHPSVTLWKTAPLTEIAKLPGTASALTFSPDSQTLAAIHSDKVVLWAMNSQVVRATLKPPQPDAGYTLSRRPPNSFSPEGKLFAVADSMHVQLWDTATGELLGLLAGPRESTRDLAWSPDGKTLASSSGSKVKLWNVATRQELTTFVGGNGAYWHAFAPDGTLMVADSMNRIRLWRTGLDQNAR